MDPGSFVVGNLIAYLEDDGIWLADVLETDGDTAVYHFRATTTASFKSAALKLVCFAIQNATPS